MLLLAAAVAGCASKVPLQTGDTGFSYKASGSIDYDFNTTRFAGDLAVYGDDTVFYLEVFSFGNLLFKMGENGGNTSIYFMNEEYDTKTSNLALPVPFGDFKRILVNVIRGIPPDTGRIGDTTITLRRDGGFDHLVFFDPFRGYVRVSIERQP